MNTANNFFWNEVDASPQQKKNKMLRQTKTLSGLFYETKSASKKNFIKENVKRVRKIKQEELNHKNSTENLKNSNTKPIKNNIIFKNKKSDEIDAINFKNLTIKDNRKSANGTKNNTSASECKRLPPKRKSLESNKNVKKVEKLNNNEKNKDSTVIESKVPQVKMKESVNGGDINNRKETNKSCKTKSNSNSIKQKVQKIGINNPANSQSTEAARSLSKEDEHNNSSLKINGLLKMNSTNSLNLNDCEDKILDNSSEDEKNQLVEPLSICLEDEQNQSFEHSEDEKNQLTNFYEENDKRKLLNFNKKKTNNKVSSNHNNINASHPTHRLGEVPKYIKDRKESLRQEKLAKKKITDCPFGHVLLPDNERQETLNILKKNYQDYINELNLIPIRTDTLKSQKRKIEIEKQLNKLEEAIKVFSRPKVFVKIDS